MPPISPDRQRAIKIVAAIREKEKELTLLFSELEAILCGDATVGDKLRELYGIYLPLWEREYGTRYKVTPADAKGLKKLLPDFSVEELAARMASFLANKDQFYARERHTLTKFCYSINSHAGIPNHTTVDDAATTTAYLRKVRG